MNLSRRILSGLAVVLPPDHLDYFHAAIWPCGRRIVFEKFWQNFFDRFSVGVTKSSLLRQLVIHASVENIDASVDSMLHSHCVRAALGSVAFATNALRDLNARYFHRFETEGRLHCDRAADRNRNTRIAFLVAALGFILLRQSEQLPKSSHIYPLLACQIPRFLRAEPLSERFFSAVPKARSVVVLSIVGLHEDV